MPKPWNEKDNAKDLPDFHFLEAAIYCFFKTAAFGLGSEFVIEKRVGCHRQSTG